MSFQWIIDNAETMSMNRLPVVASTTARDGTTRSVSRGPAPWTFTVKVADGISWSKIRSQISQAEALNKLTPGTINFAHSGYDWLVKYQGDYPSYTGFFASWVNGADHIELAGGLGAGIFRFRAGDFIQLTANGSVYTVAEDLPSDQVILKLHRAVIEPTTANSQILVAENCTWKVRCTNFPSWSLMARDQVSWDGAFTFVEEVNA
jgi:hypothetical protein